jgi:hypothetical protein
MPTIVTVLKWKVKMPIAQYHQNLINSVGALLMQLFYHFSLQQIVTVVMLEVSITVA